MKSLSLLIALLLSVSSFASVSEDAAALGKLALGHKVHQVRGRTAGAMLKKWLGEDTPLVKKEIEQMTYGDESDTGLTSLQSAREMMLFAASIFEDRLDWESPEDKKATEARLKKLKANWPLFIERLAEKGVQFGYSGRGPGSCGISFVELLLIDVREQKVYEIYLSESGEC